jgi:uncharacterized membrane protein
MGLALYNLMQFWVTRRASVGYYILYLLGFSFGNLFLTGMLFQVLPFNDPKLKFHLGFSALQFGVLASLSFAHSFLRLPKVLPRGQFLLLLLLPLTILLIAIGYNLAGDFTAAGWWNIQAFAISGLIVVGLGITTAFKRQRPGYFFTAGWGLVVSGMMVYIGNLVGLLPESIWTRHAHLLGTSLEFILFSFALADQLKQVQLKIAKEKEHAFSQLKKMVYPHQLQQMKAGDNLEDTMPCASSEAIVICFDVVGSSRMKHPQTKDFFSRVFEGCHKLMEREYQFQPLKAHGFRLKEMGDGFLCSVNFPFQSPADKTPEDLALNLAYGFFEVFDKEALRLNMPQPCQASVGIAKGYV